LHIHNHQGNNCVGKEWQDINEKILHQFGEALDSAVYPDLQFSRFMFFICIKSNAVRQYFINN